MPYSNQTAIYHNSSKVKKDYLAKRNKPTKRLVLLPTHSSVDVQKMMRTNDENKAVICKQSSIYRKNESRT